MASKPRVDLSAFLRQKTGIENLYFEPPSTVKMKYPCIVYFMSHIEQTYADNSVYRVEKRYELKLITPDPDNEYVDKLAVLPMCHFSRTYTADNLHHYAFEIYY